MKPKRNVIVKRKSGLWHSCGDQFYGKIVRARGIRLCQFCGYEIRR